MVKLAVSPLDIPKTFLFTTGCKFPPDIWNPAKTPPTNSTFVGENVILTLNMEYCQTILYFGKRVCQIDLPSSSLCRSIVSLRYFNLRHRKFILSVSKGRIGLDNIFLIRIENALLGTATVQPHGDQTLHTP